MEYSAFKTDRRLIIFNFVTGYEWGSVTSIDKKTILIEAQLLIYLSGGGSMVLQKEEGEEFVEMYLKWLEE